MGRAWSRLTPRDTFTNENDFAQTLSQLSPITENLDIRAILGRPNVANEPILHNVLKVLQTKAGRSETILSVLAELELLVVASNFL